MMRTDTPAFTALMQSVGVVFDKPPSAETIEAYWMALKDLPWEVVRDCAASHVRFGRFFPKPLELRPKGDKPPTPVDTAAMDNADKTAVAAWEWQRQTDPMRFWTEFEQAYLARLAFLHEPHSPEYEAKRDRCVRRCAEERYKLQGGAVHQPVPVVPALASASAFEDFF